MRRKKKTPQLPKPLTNASGHPTRGLNILVTDQERAAIRQLGKLTNKPYLSDVVRIALGVYTIFLEEHLKGREWYSENKDGTGRERLRMVQV